MLCALIGMGACYLLYCCALGGYGAFCFGVLWFDSLLMFDFRVSFSLR